MLQQAVLDRFGARWPDLSETLAHHVAGMQRQRDCAQHVELAPGGAQFSLACLGTVSEDEALFHLVVRAIGTDEPDLTLTFVTDRSGGSKAPGSLDISRRRWADMNLAGLELPGACLRSVAIERCVLDGARLSGVRMHQCRWLEVRAGQADLTRATLDQCTWTASSLDHAALEDSTWTDSVLQRVETSACDWSGARLTDCVGMGWSAPRCRWKLTHFSRCILDTTSALPAEASPTCLGRRSDLMVEGDSVLVNADAPSFMNDFCDTLRSFGVSSFQVRGGSIWVRDTQFKAALHGAGPAFHVHVEPRHPNDLIAGDPLLKWHRRHTNSVRSIVEDPDQTGKPVEAAVGQGAPRDLLLPSGLRPPLAAAFTAASDRFIEGGNLIVIDDDLALVGNDTLLHPGHLPDGPRPDTPANRAKADRAYPTLGGSETRWAVWNQRKLAKEDMAQLLGVKTLLLLPQWSFHIDLQVAFIGPRKVLVHSFEATVDFLVSERDALVAALGEARHTALLKGNQAMAARWERDVIDDTLKKLRRAGVEAQPVCGMLTEGVNERGMPQNLCSLLVNGLGVDRGAGRSPVFLTAGSPALPVHEAHFRAACRTMGVEVGFLVGEGRDGLEDPQAFIARQHGGVRCLSNTNTLGWMNGVIDA